MAGGTPRRGRASGRGRATGRRGDGRTANRGGARAARGGAPRGGTLRTLSRVMARGGGVGGGSGVNGRIRLLGIGLTAFLFLVGFRAVALASSSANLGRIAQEQQTATITLPSHRGSILDRAGNELAVGQPAQTVYATPYLLHGQAAAVSAADKLCGALRIHKKSQRRALEKALSQSKSGFAYVARMVDPQLAKAALALNIPGVGSYAEEERVYPMKDSATQLLGVTGVDNNGLAGLELEYNKALSGKAGSETVVRDPAGQTLKVVHQTQPVSGADVRLTIDEEIQCTAEAVLKQTLHTSGAKQATAIVMDPRSGEVLAMANLPMEANANYGDKPAWDRNRAVTDVYEPGSIFKLVTVSGALAEGLVTPQQRFWCPPTLRVADRVIHEAETRGGKDFSVTDIIAQSSNIGAVKIGKLVGMDGLIHWMKVFGFDKPTGVGFPGEVGGIVPAAGQWSGSSIANIPIGQGVAVTPIQMAAAFSAVANDGVYVKPRLVAQVGTKVYDTPQEHRILPVTVAREMRKMLVAAVDHGTGTKAQIPGYVVGGKTGTAQKPDSHGGYSDTNFVASFVGMVPAGHPQLVVLVSVDEPRSSIYGGDIAAPAVKQIMQFCLQHLEIAP